MNIRRLVLATAFFVAGCSIAAAAALPRPKCDGVFGFCRYVDASGAQVISGNFERAENFSNGLAAVRIEGLWGYVDLAGTVVIQPQFQAAGNFIGERATAVINDRAGVVDRSGAFVIPPKFSAAVPFTNDVALVGEGDAPARLDVANLELLFLIQRYRLYHRTDGFLTPERQFRWSRSPREGSSNRIWASSEDSLFGLMDERGEWVTKPQFAHVQPVMDGLAVVSTAERRWGAVDEAGKIAIPLKYDWLSYFENGYSILGGPGEFGKRKEGLIRKDGTVVAEPIYDKAERPALGRAARVQRDGKWYVVAGDGALEYAGDAGRTGPASDGDVLAACPQGLKIRKTGEQFIVENGQGKPAFDQPADYVDFGIQTPPGFISAAELKSFNLECTAPIIVGFRQANNQKIDVTFVKPDGSSLLEQTMRFNKASRFYYSYSLVEVAGSTVRNWGVLDETGAYSAPLQPQKLLFDLQASARIKSAVFRRGEGEAAEVVDASGMPAPEIAKALDQLARKDALSCAGGARIISGPQGYGLVGSDDAELIAPVHRALSCFRNGVAWAPDDERQQWCPVGPDGKFRPTPACIEAYYSKQVTHSFPEKFADGAYENSVLWMKAGLEYGFGKREKPPVWVSDSGRGRISSSILPFSP